MVFCMNIMTCTTLFDKRELFDLSQQSSDAETIPYADESLDRDGGIDVEILNDQGYAFSDDVQSESFA